MVNKAGGLIFSHDQPSPKAEVETTFNYPLRMVLEEVDRNIVVKFGEQHGIQGKLSGVVNLSNCHCTIHHLDSSHHTVSYFSLLQYLAVVFYMLKTLYTRINNVATSLTDTVGYSLTSINGTALANKCLPDGTNAMKVIEDRSKYPLTLKFTRLRVSINERIMLLSMLHS